MVYAVVGRRDKDVLKPAHFTDKLRVYENAPGLGNRKNEQNVQRLAPDQAKRNEVNEPVKRLEHRRAKAHREVVLFGGVVCNMHRQKKRLKWSTRCSQ